MVGLTAIWQVGVINSMWKGHIQRSDENDWIKLCAASRRKSSPGCSSLSSKSDPIKLIRKSAHWLWQMILHLPSGIVVVYKLTKFRTDSFAVCGVHPFAKDHSNFWQFTPRRTASRPPGCIFMQSVTWRFASLGARDVYVGSITPELLEQRWNIAILHVTQVWPDILIARQCWPELVQVCFQ